ncbi:MAG: hypothetical protein D6732_18075, partial [Methanobacteriota archaeon]
MKKLLILTLALSAVFSSGCVTDIKSSKKQVRIANSLSDKIDSGEYASSLEKRNLIVNNNDDSILAISKEPNVIGKHIPTDWLHEKVGLHQIDLVSPMDLVNFFASLGVDTEITPEARNRLNLFINGDSGSSGGQSSAPSVSPVSGGSTSSGFSINLSGTWERMFNLISTQAGIYWEATGNKKVKFFVYKIRRYDLPVVAGTSDFNDNQTALQSGGGSSSSDSIGGSTTTKIKLDIWSDIEHALNAVVSPNGSVTVLKSSGSIIVKDEPPAIAQADAIMKNIISMLSRQIEFDIAILAWRKSDQDSGAFNVDAIFNTRRIAANMVSNIATIQGASNSTITIVRPTNKWNGTRFVLQALSSVDGVSILYQDVRTTSNLMPVAFKSTREVSYIESVSGGAVSNGVATAPSVTPGKVAEGFSIHLLPKILPNNDIQVFLDASISSISRIRSISVGGGNNQASMELPEMNLFWSPQNVRIHDGDVVIMASTSLHNMRDNRS